MAVVDALAGAEGVDPTDLDLRLGDFVDPEAIDRLAAGSTASWRLEFEVAGHRIDVSHDGTVVADPEDGTSHVSRFESG